MSQRGGAGVGGPGKLGSPEIAGAAASRPAKTNTERAQVLRQRRADAGLSEVRGIWAPASLHDEIREVAAKLQRRRERAAKKL